MSRLWQTLMRSQRNIKVRGWISLTSSNKYVRGKRKEEMIFQLLDWPQHYSLFVNVVPALSQELELLHSPQRAGLITAALTADDAHIKLLSVFVEQTSSPPRSSPLWSSPLWSSPLWSSPLFWHRCIKKLDGSGWQWEQSCIRFIYKELLGKTSWTSIEFFLFLFYYYYYCRSTSHCTRSPDGLVLENQRVNTETVKLALRCYLNQVEQSAAACKIRQVNPFKSI